MHVLIESRAAYEKLVAANVGGCFARFFGPAQRAQLVSHGLCEWPPAPEGYWAAAENPLADLDAGKPVQWWPVRWVQGAGPTEAEQVARVEALLAA